MVSRLAVVVLLLVFLIGCRPATPPPIPSELTEVASDPGDAPTTVPSTPATDQAVEVRNAQYELGTTDSPQVVQLTDGVFEQGAPGSAEFISVRLTDFVTAGDLNADGTDEVVALVSENYGGTGVFVFLAVYSNIDGTLTFQTSRIVDDRPQLKDLSIANGEIYLEAVIHGPDEPMCCPTLRTARHYRWVDNQLDMIDYTTFTPNDEPRTIVIESPSDGAEVFTTVPIKGKVTIAPFENNLVYRIYDVSGIELSAGAIMVAASDPGAPGTFEEIIPLGNHLSGAILRLEVQDVSAADGSLLAMDSVELVVK